MSASPSRHPAAPPSSDSSVSGTYARPKHLAPKPQLERRSPHLLAWNRAVSVVFDQWLTERAIASDTVATWWNTSETLVRKIRRGEASLNEGHIRLIPGARREQLRARLDDIDDRFMSQFLSVG
jgi:hypothetical protein